MVHLPQRNGTSVTCFGRLYAFRMELGTWDSLPGDELFAVWAKYSGGRSPAPTTARARIHMTETVSNNVLYIHHLYPSFTVYSKKNYPYISFLSNNVI
jgi:hypothetical protein